MIKSIRSKVANAINPEKTHTYPFVELKCATPQSENIKKLKIAHREFEKENGRMATDNAEAWEWDRKKVNIHLEKLGFEPASTEFIPSHFCEKENTLESDKEQG